METVFVDYLLAMLNVVSVFFSTYSGDIVSTGNLRSVVSDMFFFRMTLSYMLFLMFIYLSLSYFFLFCCYRYGEIKMNTHIH